MEFCKYFYRSCSPAIPPVISQLGGGNPLIGGKIGTLHMKLRCREEWKTFPKIFLLICSKLLIWSQCLVLRSINVGFWTQRLRFMNLQLLKKHIWTQYFVCWLYRVMSVCLPALDEQVESYHGTIVPRTVMQLGYAKPPRAYLKFTAWPPRHK